MKMHQNQLEHGRINANYGKEYIHLLLTSKYKLQNIDLLENLAQIPIVSPWVFELCTTHPPLWHKGLTLILFLP